VQEYEYNLANLIRDMRDDLDAPTMPVLVGGMGQLGVNASGRYVVSEILWCRIQKHCIIC
jgi:hypothetical protein